MPALFTPDLDFQLLFGALPTPHAVLAPTGTVLGLNTAAGALLGDDGRAADVMGHPLRALHAALTAAGHVLAPSESLTAALYAAQSGSVQVLAPTWQAPEAGQPAPCYWEATLQPVAAGGRGTAGAIRYHLLRLLDVSSAVTTATPSAERLQQMLAGVPAIMATVEGPEHRFAFTNPAYDVLTEGRAQLGVPVLECFPELLDQNFIELLDHVYRTGLTVTGQGAALRLRERATQQVRTCYLDYSYQPLRDAAGVITGVTGFAVEVTAQVTARQQTEARQVRASVADLRLRRQAEVLPFITFITDALGRTTYISAQWYQYTGLPAGTGWAEVDVQWPQILHPDDLVRAQQEIAASIDSPRLGRVEVRLRGADGQYRWFITEAVPELDAEGRLLRRNGYMLDVHELRETQRCLEAKDRLLSQILAQAPAYIAAFAGPEHCYSFFNADYNRMMGSRPQLGQPLARLRPGVNDQGYLAILDGVYRTGEPFVGREMPVRLPAAEALAPDTEHYFNFSFLPMLDEHGGVNGILSFAIDVSEQVLTRRQAIVLARQVKQRDEQLRAITLAVPVFIVNFDQHGALTYLNAYFYEYTGRDPAEPLAESWQSLPPGDRAAVQARALAAMQAGQAWEASFRCRRHDGELRWMQARAQPYLDPSGQLAGFSAATTEVHELHVRTEELTRSREDFAALADHMAQLAWTALPDGRVNYCNQRWHDYTGIGFEGLKDWDWQSVLHPDDLPETLRQWQHSLATGEMLEHEARWRRHDGEYRWFLTRAESLRDARGTISTWVGANTDVHDFRQVRQELEANNARLRRSNEDLDTFVYMASHDLKQPITNMAGIFEELTRTAYFRDPEAVQLIGYFERALRRIFATIDDLGAIVQVQRLQQEVSPEPVALAVLLNEVLEGLHDQLVQGGGQVECDFTTYPVVSFVRPNLHSILLNLLGNSLRYASPGRPPRIRLSSAPDLPTGRPVLTVQDNGLGIDLERYGPQLFQLFRRFHPHVDGTGIGLYLINRIVQNHGGRIEVSSAVDEGTTFRLYL